MDSERRPATPRATKFSIQEALRRFIQQAPLPFAITRGAEHTLVYVNAAFCRLAGIANGDAPGYESPPCSPRVKEER
jgi:PAS domain-containing protein